MPPLVSVTPMSSPSPAAAPSPNSYSLDRPRRHRARHPNRQGHHGLPSSAPTALLASRLPELRGRRSLPPCRIRPSRRRDDAAASEAPAASPRHRYPRRGDAAPFAYPHTRDDRVVSTIKHEKAAKHRRLKVPIYTLTPPRLR
ncbi:hypothetical protein BRADI_4g22203v3 [Brachypodium distachyon]|uniref:Uncharacterized protein n=1 Tax=Brachypodium distachyon TaxID=15368 RepID=A0A2K2CPF4_BRADI|nr:hypothetical protein BRADI_4g22203v3 [Brachypodium distachyon]